MKILIVRIISLLLSILMAVLIFSLSADTAEESGNLSEEITEKVLSTVGIDKESTPVEEYKKTALKVEFSIRKLAHFSEYFLFGLFLCIFFRTFDKKLWMTLLFTLGIAVPYAALDEWHQAFVPGRGPAVWDVMIDSSGALGGALLALLGWYLIDRFMKKRSIHS